MFLKGLFDLPMGGAINEPAEIRLTGKRGNSVKKMKAGDHWLDEFVPYQIYRTANCLNELMRRRLKNTGINIARWRVLSILKAFGTLSITDIVELTLMQQPTISRVVNQLDKQGLIERGSSSSDSRFVNVTLTKQGLEAFETIYPAAQRHQDRAFDGFSSDEIKDFLAYLKRIQVNISDFG